jgi:hypothetical protein
MVKLIENEYVRKEDRMVVAYVGKADEDEEYEGYCLVCPATNYFLTSNKAREEVVKALEDHLEKTHGLGRDKCEWLGWHWITIW